MVDSTSPTNRFEDQPYDWFPGLSEGFRQDMRKLIDDALERVLVQAWLRKIEQALGLDISTLRSRLRLLGLGDVFPPVVAPSLEVWLGYGIATDTLGDDTFKAYVDVLVDPTPLTDDWWDGLARATREIWTTHAELAAVILPHWYRHALRQLEPPTPSAGSESGSLAGLDDIVETPSLGTIAGLLFTGPRSPTAVVARPAGEGHQEYVDLTLAHLRAHYDRGDVPRGQFGLWIDYQPGATPPWLVKDWNHWYAEEQADDLAVRYLDSNVGRAGPTPQGRRTFIGLTELGLAPLLLPLFLLLRRLRGGRKTARPVPGLLVCGDERHVYLIDECFRKRWVCSKCLLYTSAYPRKIHQLRPEVLWGLQAGPPIFTLATMEKMRLQFVRQPTPSPI